MSYPDQYKLTLSPQAKTDFTDILRYTGQTWGRHQLQIYSDKIDAALQAIRRHPNIGHCRNDLPATHLALPVGEHVIVYRMRTDDIAVVRILHQRRCMPNHV